MLVAGSCSAVLMEGKVELLPDAGCLSNVGASFVHAGPCESEVVVVHWLGAEVSADAGYLELGGRILAMVGCFGSWSEYNEC
jgi:hypothetical protein